MAKSIRRNITIGEDTYYWVLNGNSTEGFNGKEHHIRVHIEGVTKSILYIDPYSWEFEVRPKTIAMAIEFAIKNGCKPTEKGNEMYVSLKGDNFYVLPKGKMFGYQNNV